MGCEAARSSLCGGVWLVPPTTDAGKADVVGVGLFLENCIVDASILFFVCVCFDACVGLFVCVFVVYGRMVDALAC